MIAPHNHPKIATQQLILRRFELTDAAAVQRLAGDRAIADTTVEIPHPYENGVAESWISTHAEELSSGAGIHFAVTLKSTRELVGSVSLMKIDQRHARAELGYWIGQAYWNNGYCTEAARGLIQFGFRKLRLNRIFARHFTRNPASGAVLKKIGMQYEGLQRQHFYKWGIFEDVALYAIINPNHD